MIETILQGKIRIKLLTRLLLNPSNQVYLRGLEREFGVSSNTVRLELNKLHDLNLIQVVDDGHVKKYTANTNHELFQGLRGYIFKQIGLDSLLESVFERLGELEAVYLTNDWANGKESPIIDFVVVGNIDKIYMMTLIDKAEKVIGRKIRVAVYGSDFEVQQLFDVPAVRLV